MDPVLRHHLYEYKKGLRRLILHTVKRKTLPEIVARLARENIACCIYLIGDVSANVFFGDAVCIDIIKNINKPQLSEYTPEEDFILGTMLGYCRHEQCVRYLKMKKVLHGAPDADNHIYSLSFSNN